MQMKSSENDNSLNVSASQRRLSAHEKNLQVYFETAEWSLLEKYLRGQVNQLTHSLNQILSFKNSTITRRTEYEIWLQHEQRHLATWARLELPDFSYMLPLAYRSTLSMVLRIRYDGVVEIKITLKISHEMENFELVLSRHRDSDLSLSTRPKSKPAKTPGCADKPIYLTNFGRTTPETSSKTPTSDSLESPSINDLSPWFPAPKDS
jgi:hypothetical protein